MALLKVNTKGGNRPIRAWYAPESAQSPAKAFIVYAYGDCLALAFKSPSQSDHDHQIEGKDQTKTDLLPSLHGREIMTAIGLAKGKTIVTGSEDTTFKVLQVHPSGHLKVV